MKIIENSLRFVLLAVPPIVFAGCASTNPGPAFNDVDKTVLTRLGQSVQWQNTNGVAQTVATLLQTNLIAQSAVTIALLNNKSLQAEFGEIGISQAELAQAARLHNIELFGSWRFPNRPPSAVDAEYSATADFLDLLTLPARKKIAAQNLEQTKQQVAGKVLQLAAETQAQFYDLQAKLELVKRLETIVAANDVAADFAQRQYDAGDITDLELHNQQAQAMQSHLDLMNAKAETLAQREQLNRLLGLSGDQINWQIADELPSLPDKELPLENLELLAVNQRLDLAAARNQIEAIATALRLEKKVRFIPVAALGVDTERTPDGQRVTGPTLDLEIPIFDQGQPAVAKLVAEFQQAKDNYDALEVNIRSEVREARNALLAAREAVEFSENNLLPSQQTILKETLLQYNAMQKNSFDLAFAKEREQNAEQSSIEALRDYWIARVELERAVGGRLINETNTFERSTP
ncbi:MAG TPA: TolC family protein [Candidatus Sulfotelmatobacter sp.]|nr:TolC family protein [Candidatus Sulfotelmatobacter sp.]